MANSTANSTPTQDQIDAKKATERNIRLAEFRFNTIADKYPDAAKAIGTFAKSFSASVTPAQMLAIIKSYGE